MKFHSIDYKKIWKFLKPEFPKSLKAREEFLQIQRFSAYFGNSAKFWLGLQDDYDIEYEMSEKSNEIKRFERIRAAKEKDVA